MHQNNLFSLFNNILTLRLRVDRISSVDNFTYSMDVSPNFFGIWNGWTAETRREPSRPFLFGSYIVT